MPSLSDLLLPLVTTAATALALTLCAAKLLGYRRGRGKTKLYAPVVGTIFHLLFHFDRCYDYLTDLSRRHKTFRLLAPDHDEIFTVDPANVEYILKTNFHNYVKGKEFADTMEELFGNGIFAVDGDKWRHQRKLASFEFSTRVLRDSSSLIFKKNSLKLAQIVSQASQNGDIIDIQDLLMKSTMDSIFKVAFGVELGCLSGTNHEGSKFAKAFDDSSVQIQWRFLNPFWKIARFLKIGSEAAMIKNTMVVDDFVNKVISTEISKKSHKDNGNLSVDREDMLSRFVMQSEKDPENMNRKYLRDIILNFVIAGKDTTAGTLSWFLYMLCKHPNIQEKIYLEVREATQSENIASFEDFAVRLSEEAINKMQYLHATLSETLRLYPAVPADSKVCFSDDKLPDGFSVKKGDVVSFLPYPMGRMKFLWGEDAEVFYPERWLDDDGIYIPESPYKFTAFQAGPRICLGKEFAYRQMKMFAAVLLHFFTFSLGDEKKAVKYRTMLTLQVDGGLHIRACHR